MRPTSVARWGSEPTAAGGGRKEASAWPGSARDEGFSKPRTFAGHPNRGDTQNNFLYMSVTKTTQSPPADPTNIANRFRYRFGKTTIGEVLNYMSEQYWVEKGIII